MLLSSVSQINDASMTIQNGGFIRANELATGFLLLRQMEWHAVINYVTVNL